MEKLPSEMAERHRELSLKASQSRLTAIQSQIDLGFTLCRVTETELAYYHLHTAHELLQKVRQTCSTIRRHLSEHSHVPPDTLEKVYARLEQLERRVDSLDSPEPPKS